MDSALQASMVHQSAVFCPMFYTHHLNTRSRNTTVHTGSTKTALHFIKQFWWNSFSSIATWQKAIKQKNVTHHIEGGSLAEINLEMGYAMTNVQSHKHFQQSLYFWERNIVFLEHHSSDLPNVRHCKWQLYRWQHCHMLQQRTWIQKGSQSAGSQP